MDDLEPSISRTRVRAILAVNDGSCPAAHQVVVEAGAGAGAGVPLACLMPMGTSVLLEGRLQRPPAGSSAERVELRVERVIEVGEVDAAAYPLRKSMRKPENFRDLMHLRARTNTVTTLFSLGGGTIPYKDDGTIAFEDDFFKRQAFLTVSGQLQAENYACALSSVYTFGPTFRAENSRTSRHLAEFWMVEPEIAFASLQDDMNCAESYIQYLCKELLEYCEKDLEFIDNKFPESPTAIERLKLVSSTPFERISYTQAVNILKDVEEGTFDKAIEWGIDLASEHERYLTEKIFMRPVIVYNYPKEIKPFYMRLNDDQKTVAAMDVLVPKVGELIGGSQREQRLDILKKG
ncbi:unnamed protein product [Urochloa decumbens]|uniref:Aminoacyl-transfer RNA synthetases class-II family profile domain-containing protein n=1 Tax=Urochloa decumbens TaxID=240449 RepID=A0ABC9D518_9POAL